MFLPSAEDQIRAKRILEVMRLKSKTVPETTVRRSAKHYMNLPKLLIKLVPDGRCIRCSQSGYVGEKCGLCLSCLNISLLLYAKRKKAEVKP